jgi:DNA-binding PadR family transcriptional regulator
VLKSTLDLMVLQIVAAFGLCTAYAIAARLERVSGGSLGLNMGILDRGLVRLEHLGLLRASWGVHRQQPSRALLCDHHAGGRQQSSERAQ